MLKMWSLAIFLGLFALSAPVNGECDAQKVEDSFMNHLDIFNLDLGKINDIFTVPALIIDSKIEELKIDALSVKVLKNGSLSVYIKANIEIIGKLLFIENLSGRGWIEINAIVGVQKNPDGTTKLVPLNISETGAVTIYFFQGKKVILDKMFGEQYLEIILNQIPGIFSNILTKMNVASGVNNMGC
ncbi:uncharacterized protein LOC115475485 isoform X2 [Microcaecilia unicolor]|nr:uncharacterized protein LOC115475485 isoform X2 [Microcaecilia unicolor]XP_030067100.1 uncharacterized protein LOC115475485 isoform X2 [Microcaecilia unicolor]